MYADIGNQAVHLIRYFGAFLLLFYFLPRLMFRKSEGDGFERAAAMFLKMTLFVIATGYALVLLKLFEVLGILAVYGLVSAHRTSERWKAANARRLEHLTVGAFDLLEGKLPLKERLMEAARRRGERWKEAMLRRAKSPTELWAGALMVVVFGAAAYVRMYDALTSAAPALSDGNVTLEWMKHIDNRQLFVSGVYPHGFHIWLDTIHKFAMIDSVYVLKYTGPFNMLLIMAGMYLYLSRAAGDRWAALLAAAVFGILGMQFGGTFERQTATNSQEFAFVFVFPTLYFLHRYFQEKRKDDLVVAAAGMAATGMVHAIGFVYLGWGVAVTMAYFLLTRGRDSWKPALGVCAAGAAAVGAAAAPIAIGLFLMGRSFHSSSAEYLVSEADQFVTFLRDFDYAALYALALAALALLLRLRRFRSLSSVWIMTTICASTFVLYNWGAALTQSQVVATRSGELWGLAVPMAIGCAAHLATRPLLENRRSLQLLLVTAAVAAMLAVWPPKPFIPYKMTWDSNVEQYLRISAEYRPNSWMIVSKEDDYAVVYGSGYHMYLRKLVENYDPAKAHLTKRGENEIDGGVPDDVFIYVEKTIFKVEETNSIFPLRAEHYVRWEQETKDVQAWVDAHRDAGHPVEVYHEDERLIVYHLHREPTREEMMQRIWGS